MAYPITVGVCPRPGLPFFYVFIAFWLIVCTQVAIARGEMYRSVGPPKRQTKDHYYPTRSLLLEDRGLTTEGAGVKMGHVNARFSGIRADIPNWNPKLEDEAHEYSSSFIMAEFESWFIRLGWEVNPARHNGDNRAYPFILTHNGTHSWYEDEVDCFQYIQDRKSLMDKPLDISVHNFTLNMLLHVLPSLILLPKLVISSADRLMYANLSSKVTAKPSFSITYRIKLPSTSIRTDKTWVTMMNSQYVPIGSWKRKCNPDMQRGASFLQWGGEVGYPMSRKLGQQPHTTAEMGNGLAPDAEILGGSGYISNLKYKDHRHNSRHHEPSRVGVLAPVAYGNDCYNAILSPPETTTAPYLGMLCFYGGPVGSDLCGR